MSPAPGCCCGKDLLKDLSADSACSGLFFFRWGSIGEGGRSGVTWGGHVGGGGVTWRGEGNLFFIFLTLICLFDCCGLLVVRFIFYFSF